MTPVRSTRLFIIRTRPLVGLCIGLLLCSPMLAVPAGPISLDLGIVRTASAADADDIVRGGGVAVWGSLEWTDMTPAEQGLWQTLGWTEASWNEEAEPPASESKEWSELTPKELLAAERLGFDQRSWDGSE
jgi:hypothetical protein